MTDNEDKEKRELEQRELLQRLLEEAVKGATERGLGGGLFEYIEEGEAQNDVDEQERGEELWGRPRDDRDDDD